MSTLGVIGRSMAALFGNKTDIDLRPPERDLGLFCWMPITARDLGARLAPLFVLT